MRNATPGCWRRTEVRDACARAPAGHGPVSGHLRDHDTVTGEGKGALHGSAAARFHQDAELQEKRAGTPPRPAPHQDRHPPQRPSGLTQPAPRRRSWPAPARQETPPGKSCGAGPPAASRAAAGRRPAAPAGGRWSRCRHRGRTASPARWLTAARCAAVGPGRLAGPVPAEGRGGGGAPPGGPGCRPGPPRTAGPRWLTSPGGGSGGALGREHRSPFPAAAAAAGGGSAHLPSPRPGRAAAAAQGRCGEGRSRPPPRHGGAAHPPGNASAGPAARPGLPRPGHSASTHGLRPRLCWDTGGALRLKTLLGQRSWAPTTEWHSDRFLLLTSSKRVLQHKELITVSALHSHWPSPLR